MSVSDSGDEFIVASAIDLKLFSWNVNKWLDAYETLIDSVLSIADWSVATYTTIGKRITDAGEVKTLAVYFEKIFMDLLSYLMIIQNKHYDKYNLKMTPK